MTGRLSGRPRRRSPFGRVVSVTRADIQRRVDIWRAELASSTVRRMYSAVARHVQRRGGGGTYRPEPLSSYPATGRRFGGPPRPRGRPAGRGGGRARRPRPHGLAGAVLGLRWGEVAALPVDSFDFLHGSIAGKQGLDEVAAFFPTLLSSGGGPGRTCSVSAAISRRRAAGTPPPSDADAKLVRNGARSGSSAPSVTHKGPTGPAPRAPPDGCQ